MVLYYIFSNKNKICNVKIPNFGRVYFFTRIWNELNFTLIFGFFDASPRAHICFDIYWCYEVDDWNVKSIFSVAKQNQLIHSEWFKKFWEKITCVMNWGYISCWWYGTFTWMLNFIQTMFRWILLIDPVIDYFIEIAGGFRWAILMSKLLTCKCKPHFSTRIFLSTFASIGGEGRTKFFPSGGEM